ELGPTFVKLGQVLSIRPDVLPEKTMKELARLQDNIETFSNEEAKAVIEEELGQSVEELFSSFSKEPIAAASLAQVYRATLKTGEEVAVKVQRPGALSTISKDLYVLRRLADVMQPLIRRFTADETDYIALTETFAEGLYTELDFRNEALNAIRMEELLRESLEPEALDRIVIPGPLMSLTKRRVMLSKWVNGVKLSTLPSQEVFLTQLLDIGFFHGDPHPGNLLKITEGPDAGKLCLLDFGLVAQVPREDRELIISAVVHLGTQNWEALIADFQQLRFLAEDVDQAALVPILQRVLGPYLKGGGAQAFKNANFQALTQVKFSIPPYVSLLARSVATLEGVALQGDPQYQIVAMAYPFVVRRLLQNSNRRSFAALRELLYDPQTRRMRPQRLATLLQASLGVVAGASEGSRSGFIDFDAVPEEGAPAKDVVRFLLSPAARNLRPLLNAELTYGLDLVLRRTGRRLRTTLQDLLQPRLPLLGRLPALPAPPLLIPVPRNVGGSNAEIFEKGLAVLPAEDIFEAVLPALGTSEDVDFGTFRDAFQGLGIDIGDIEQLVPDVLRAAMRALLGNGEDAELAEALRQALGQESRETLANEVVASIAEELLRTWRARLAAMDAVVPLNGYDFHGRWWIRGPPAMESSRLVDSDTTSDVDLTRFVRFVAGRCSEATGVRVSSAEQLEGGCGGGACFRLRRDNGDDLFAKIVSSREEQDSYEALFGEHQALEALAAFANDAFTVPRQDLGAALGSLHAASLGASAVHGFGVATCCGHWRFDNRWQSDWPTFFEHQRLQPLLQAVEATCPGPLTPALLRLSGACLRPLFAGAELRPCLLHGDFWRGNFWQCEANFPHAQGRWDRACSGGTWRSMGSYKSRVTVVIIHIRGIYNLTYDYP
ncbi:unnamed protein product, partial [Symbiodinium sp. KB8]